MNVCLIIQCLKLVRYPKLSNLTKMTKREKDILDTVNFGLFIMILFVFVIQLYFGIQLHKLENQIVKLNMSHEQIRQIYTGLTLGKIVDKKEKDNKHIITVTGYGIFLVDKETYDKVVIGDDMPKEIRDRVEVRNGVGG